MNCCEILRVNGIVTHEIGCPNQGRAPVREKVRHYVGITKGDRTRRYFRTTLEPVPHYFPEYAAVIGPFKTQRGARWAAAHPYGWNHVSEAEQKAKSEKEVQP